MDWVYAGLVAIGLVLLAPLWGWMWRDMRKRRGTGGLGDALLEMNRFTDPSQEHVAAAKTDRRAERRQGEPPLPPSNTPSPIKVTRRP